ncbi:MAG: hypothetical protein FJZ63_07810 [Chlamydiae bacterium]|nr:hypothetical protein [Chlamydiota bacterium]
MYTLQEKLLPHLLFPIGDFEKNYVRQLAKEASLSTSEKKDSTGICFIGKRNFQQFIAKYLPVESGPILDTQGRHLGNHVGALYYTIGQRKGLGIGGQGDAWFVVDKDVKNNTLYVAQGAAHPALFSQKLLAHTPSWVNGPPSLLPKKCFAKIRYRQADQECLIENISPENFQVSFIKPQWAITPGQSIVLYEENRCLGGGIISHKF